MPNMGESPMNMDLDDFDLGPLTWVKVELDNALVAAREALVGWNGEDLNPLKAAAAHLHQVYGALQIVDLQGVSLLTAETEHLLNEMSNQAALRNQASADAVLVAIDALKAYLDALLAGAPHAELRLTPVYQAVVAQRGGEKPAPSELFFPNTDARPPRREKEMPLDDTARARAIHAARVSYQRGLLKVLQNKEPLAGLMLMEQAVRQVEALAPSTTQYGFWWATAGLIDALRRESVPVDIWVKRLCGRIDLQMRRLMEGSRQLAERLFRDVLYYVAQDAVPSGRAAEVDDLFQLRRYFPAVETGARAEHLPFIASLKDNLNNAKDHWIRYCGGRAESLEPFQQAATDLFEAAVRLPNQAMKDLVRIVQAVAKRMPGVGDASHNEALQVEMATALLLGLNAVEHFEDLGEEFVRQSEAQAMRVQAAIDPGFNTDRIPQVDMLDEISHAAQEKLLLAQVTHEVQANLYLVEEVLDKFFRNDQERGGLPMVPGLLKQILGAFNILQLDVASKLVTEAMTRIGHFNEADMQIPPQNLDWVAEALSTLGLYVDALRYGRDDSTAMARLLATPEAKAKPKEVSVEAQARSEAQRLREAVGQWVAGGGDEASKTNLKADLANLVRDAELIGDAALRTQVDNLLKAMDSTSVQTGAAKPGMAAPEKVVPSAQAQRLAGASSDVVDQELLETFVEEANEVLGTIAVQVSRLHVSPYDTEAFTVIRRSFHTLKGSGRMVGLTELAEPAWEVEQTLNQWLRDERAPTPELLGFLEEAGNAFQVWAMELEEHGKTGVEAGRLIATAKRLRGESSPEPGVMEESPPKAEAGESVESTTAAGETESELSNSVPQSVENADVDVEGHILPAELFQVFTGEAAQRLQDMAIALAEMARAPRPGAWEAFIRAAHTLAGISRTTGFTPIAEAAHAVERWGGRWPDKTLVLPDAVVSGLEGVIGLLTAGFKEVKAHRFPKSMDPVMDLLASLSEDIPAEPAQVQEEVPPRIEAEEQAMSADEIAAEEAALEREVQAALAQMPNLAPPPKAKVVMEMATVRDELDEELLPIFLEEAEELLPRIGEALRNWRAWPDAAGVGDALKRVLHTLKGSARMAGAMTLGERVHVMESRVLEPEEGDAINDFLDQLEVEYDHIHDLVERLKAGPAVSMAATGEAMEPLQPAPSQAEEAISDGLEVAGAQDELDEQLLPIFLEEADELLPHIGEALRNWRAHPDQAGAGDALKRTLHTLKGSGRMAGAMVLGERVHAMETQVLTQAEGVIAPEFLEYLEGEYDHIHAMVERLKTGPGAAVGEAGAALDKGQAPAMEMPATEAIPAPIPTPVAKSSLEDELRLRQALRLKSDVLDTLLNEAGEISIARARIENVLKGYKQTAQELAANVDRLRAQLRELEIQAESQMRSRLSQMDESHFDPLEFDRFSRLQELTRQMAESVNDVSTAQDNLLSGLTEADSALIQQSRMARTLQQELMHMRMVPLNTLAERLYRIVRQSAKETGRRAQLELEGGQTELDRVVLDKIAAPLEHLVRNAVAHGVEPPELREAAGKPEYGEIRLAARQEGNEIVLTLGDDGGGVDVEAVRARAVKLGWLEPDQTITPEQVETFLFRSGFSTAAQVTELAGRGIGLDVVKNEIAGIGGRVRLESTPGQGARFTIRLPLTLALTQVVLAQAGEQTWALPANLVTLVREVKADQVHGLHEQGYIDLDGARFPLRTLAELVDRRPQPMEGRYRTVLLLKAGESRLALRVDAMEGNFEAVVKPIGPQLARIAGISGATVLGDGRVALILNPFQLAERAPVLSVEREEAETDLAPLIMVVDDSLTVRKITSRFLLREGYRVSTARDGVEALEMLEDEIPAVMLLDIEMPRMDGFEVTQSVRDNARFADLPIIMLTSRTADKHREHALELGVNSYMGKPYQEEELLAEIGRLAGEKVAA
jgi:chemosensory pili system protein ChpA (sensor histidine kinase/response regulator)